MEGDKINNSNGCGGKEGLKSFIGYHCILILSFLRALSSSYFVTTDFNPLLITKLTIKWQRHGTYRNNFLTTD